MFAIIYHKGAPSKHLYRIQLQALVDEDAGGEHLGHLVSWAGRKEGSWI